MQPPRVAGTQPLKQSANSTGLQNVVILLPRTTRESATRLSHAYVLPMHRRGVSGTDIRRGDFRVRVRVSHKPPRFLSVCRVKLGYAAELPQL
jgi:hypothetical protein